MPNGAPAKPHQAIIDRDILLATKLYAPVLRPGLVLRARLADQLDDGVGRGVALVVAPAGYGKTVLLAEWVRAATRPAAWLSLDAADNDPARFWRHVVAALEALYPGHSRPGGISAGTARAAVIRRSGDGPDQRDSG